MKLYYDLHLHSCLSPCGSEDMTPANLAGMCALAGLDVVALTDHNAVGNCPAFCEAAQALGLLALPGMELTTAEEIHVVCLFAQLDQSRRFGRLIYDHLPDRPNDTRIFGPQRQMDAEDRLVREEPRMLAGATDIGVYQVARLVEEYGGIAYPAHIDRPSFSLLSNLGIWDGALGFPVAELSRACPAGFQEQRPDLAGVRTITSSDAHYLDQIPDAANAMELPRRDAQSVLEWLKG